jgi:diguanylate cyclase (GGDEF)-like protein
VDGMLYAASDGKILNTVRHFPPKKNDNVSAREPFRYFSQNNDLATFYTIPTLVPADGKWRLGVSRRINGKDGHFLGIVTAGISVESLVAYYQDTAIKLGEGVAIALYRKQDQILLAHYPENETILGKANPARFISQSAAATGPLDKAIHTHEPGFAEHFNFSNERLRLFQKSTDFPLILGISVPPSFALEQFHVQQKWVYAGVGVACIMTIFVASLLYYFAYKTQKYQYLAGVDELTHIPNKSSANQLLKQSLAAAKRNKTQLALLYVDLDRFKEINDTAGHAIGDLVLEEIASRMKACARDSDSVCRDGGDEFVMIMPEIHDAQNALVIAQKVHNAIILPIKIGDQSYSVGASIGVALYPQHGHNEIDLLRNADNAMYAAKRANLNGIRLFGT